MAANPHRLQNLSYISRSANGIMLAIFFGSYLLEEDHELMKSTDDSKSYLRVSTSSSTKPLNETAIADIIN